MTTAQQLVTVELDGRKIQAAAGSYALQVAREAGIDIPTLCDHPALEPVGGCRLCMVEVTHPDWNGWSGLMTSCLYPVSDGLQISTASPRVNQARKQVLALLSSRCPSSELIGKLAARYEVDASMLQSEPEADSCILCGLCTRVCDSYATSAISTVGRGAAKAIGSFAGEPPGDCVGCGGCAQLCPTGHINSQRTDKDYRIWERSFPTAVAAVERTQCVGCGSCEEACPFAVARVALQAGGRRIALIAAEHCRGCGVCVGACPSGAIDQQQYGFAALAAPGGDAGHTVIACDRCGLGDGSLPPEGRLLEVPCAGRVSVPLLLATIGRGSQGALVLGRHQQTCRHNGAEDPAERRTARAAELLAMIGFGADRVRFVQPEPGSDGPSRAAERFASELGRLGPSPLAEPIGAELLAGESIDTTVSLLSWLADHSSAQPDGAAWLADRGLPEAAAGSPVLYAGVLPYLEVAAAPLIEPVRIAVALRMALDVLSMLGAGHAGIHVAGPGAVGAQAAAALQSAPAVYALTEQDRGRLDAAGVRAIGLDELIRTQASQLRRSTTSRAAVATDGSEASRSLVEALGYEVVEAGPDPLPDSFCFSPQQRSQAERHLEQAERSGARALLTTCSRSFVRWAMVTRRGSWRSSRILPIMPHQLAWYAMREPSLSLRTLTAPICGASAPAAEAS